MFQSRKVVEKKCKIILLKERTIYASYVLQKNPGYNLFFTLNFYKKI